MKIPVRLPGWRGGRSKLASWSRVRGSNSLSTGRWTPTQTVSIRPWLSKVTDAQSAFCEVESVSVSRPSGPSPFAASVW